MKKLYAEEHFAARRETYSLLPLRFHRFPGNRVLLTNMVGEHHFLPAAEFELLTQGHLTDQETLQKLRAKHMIRSPDEGVPLELLSIKTRTRYSRLPNFTGLHIFVVTLRCEHACAYCQVSRTNSPDPRFDMSPVTAALALDAVFKSPSPMIKIEFQGGEPLLNFPLIEQIVREARARNADGAKQLSFVIASNLALLDDHIIRFARDNGVSFSTSLDGPADLHNKNRPRPGGDSWERAIAGIARVRSELGHDRVAALMTTTEASLGRVRAIIDCYLEQGLRDIFLRPISPYGFAMRTKSHAAYDAARWLAFYQEGLEYILELNAAGVPMVERFAAIILAKMLTNDDPGYVDLMSPAGIGIAALVYNYDGDVYASDEARMLAEMGDTTFRLGNIHRDSLSDILQSEVLLDSLDASFAGSAPMCSDCAFETYCGADPVFHHTTAGDVLGRKPTSAFCKRNMGVFTLLLERHDADPATREVFRRWARP